ncbi:MAG TPA: diaminopimelate epimerase [Steroidobacteraceae bacterium]|nr:diaminopimelate epimerase [Steroidobacteraceae bacterium]
MRLDFVKMHGLGNDFIVFDAAAAETLPNARQLRALSNRHTGIGFDQALALAAPRRADTAVFYRIFNADGLEAEQCGNGARCIAALVARRLGRGPGELLMDSPAGLVRARIRADGLVSVAMGVPTFAPAALPFAADREAASYALEAAGERIEIGAVSIGNPHAVIRVPAVANAPVDRLGPAVENHPRFPRGTNVEFMEVVTPAHVRLRVHERGVGETQACGTGACGAVAVGRRRGWLDAEVEVDVPGGRLAVEWQRQDEPIWLTGPTATVFEGHIDL